MMTIIFVGILGAIISSITGTLWYSGSSPMGKIHMRYLGFDKLTDEEKKRMIEEAKPNMWKSYSLQMLLSFLTSLFIAFVTSYTVQNGGEASATLYYVAMIWVAFTVPIIGQNMIWGKIDPEIVWKKFFSDIFYNLITFLIIAYIATLIF